MSFKEISILRKEGKIAEAWTKAKAEMDARPDDIWSKRAFYWVLIDHLKAHAIRSEVYPFLEKLEEFAELEVPGNEEMVITNAGYWITKMVYKIVRSDDLFALESLINQIKKIIYPKPSELHSHILRAVLKVNAQWDGFLKFVEWWDFKHLRKEDYAPGVNKQGESFMSLAEQAVIAFSKKLLSKDKLIPSEREGKDGSHASYMMWLESFCAHHPEFIYGSYYLAMFYLQDNNRKLFLEKFIPFARKKANDFWIYDLLADTRQEPGERMACYCKALSVNSPDKMLVKVREKLAGLLIEQGMYPQAKTEILKVANTRQAEGWSIRQPLEGWMRSEWFEGADAVEDGNAGFYTKYATAGEGFLYENIKQSLCIIENIHTEKKLAFFMYNYEIRGNFRYDLAGIPKPLPGQFLLLRLEQVDGVDGKWFRVITACETERINPDLKKTFCGKLSILSGTGIGFVGEAFLDAGFIESHGMNKKNGNEITLNAIPSFDRKKGKWGWRAFEIV